jgi:adenylate cyclase
MPKEIERKYLVNKQKWEKVNKPKGQLYRQGYMMTDPLA